MTKVWDCIETDNFRFMSDGAGLSRRNGSCRRLEREWPRPSVESAQAAVSGQAGQQQVSSGDYWLMTECGASQQTNNVWGKCQFRLILITWKKWGNLDFVKKLWRWRQKQLSTFETIDQIEVMDNTSSFSNCSSISR